MCVGVCVGMKVLVSVFFLTIAVAFGSQEAEYVKRELVE